MSATSQRYFMQPLHIRTPLIESVPLGASVDATVWLKMESAQPTGSFKLRGVGRLCAQLANQGARHLVSSSGGNAGLAVAFAGSKLGVRVTVFVPETTPDSMRDLIASYGAEVQVSGSVWDETQRFAMERVESTGASYVPPFDHPVLWDGHASLVDEIKDAIPPPSAVVVAVGGGGLLSGVAEGLHRCGWADVPIIAVETEGAASFHAALEAGEPVDIGTIHSVARSLGARKVCRRAFDWSQRHAIIPIRITDEEAVRACRRFLDDHRVLVEPACGAALATLYENKLPLQGWLDSVLVVVCGGAGVSMQTLDGWDGGRQSKARSGSTEQDSSASS